MERKWEADGGSGRGVGGSGHGGGGKGGGDEGGGWRGGGEGRKSSIWGVWAAPDGRVTFQKDGGLRLPLFWKVSRPPGAAQIQKINDFRSVARYPTP